MVWSPPRVMTRGRVLPWRAGPVWLALVAGARDSIELWPSSICFNAYALSYLFHPLGLVVVVVVVVFVVV